MNHSTRGINPLDNKGFGGSDESKETWISVTPGKKFNSNRKNPAAGARVQYRDVFTPGLIIHANLYEEALDKARIAADDPTIIDIGAGREPICAKYRFFIVIAAHDGGYTCLPLYTHNGMGLENKKFKDEYVSVQDHRTRRPQGFFQLSKHDPLVTAGMNNRIKLSDKTTARLTYPISRDYHVPVVVEGYLDERSTKNLIALYNEYAPVEALVRPRTTARDRPRLGPVDDATDRLKNLRLGAGGENGSVVSARMGGRFVRGR